MSPTTSGRDPLSDRQRQVLDFLTDTVNDRGYPPSVREICEAVGLSSPSTVHSHLSSLVKSGYIRRDPSKPRAIEILTDESSVRSLTPSAPAHATTGSETSRSSVALLPAPPSSPPRTSRQ